MLCKADLLTGMVGEFPELQGVMGGYYARHDGEPEEVAQAIEEHYRPRFAGDALPASSTGTVAALADKLETLAGMFGIGQLPTGDKDPFALRRHALGVIRMIVEKNLNLPIAQLLGIAFDAFGGHVNDARAELSTFIYERLAGWLRERGFSAQEVDCVISQRPDNLALVPARLEAVRAFAALPEAISLAAANKRIGNILRKASITEAQTVDPLLLVEDAERALHASITSLAPVVQTAIGHQDFTGALTALASAREAVDRFFDEVMVNTDNEKVRMNRQSLLQKLRHLFLQIADISFLQAA